MFGGVFAPHAVHFDVSPNAIMRGERGPSRCSTVEMASATSTDPLERLEAMLALGRSAPSRRMLIIVNPYASTVSDRLKNLVVYALTA